MDTKEIEVWNSGRNHGRGLVIQQIIDSLLTDRVELLKEEGGRYYKLADEAINSQERLRLRAYADGLYDAYRLFTHIGANKSVLKGLIDRNEKTTNSV